MQPIQTIYDAAFEKAFTRLGEEKLDGVRVEETTDAGGSDALRIIIKLKSKMAEKIDGDSALDLLVDLRRSLEGLGEERLPIVEYEEEGEEIEEE